MKHTKGKIEIFTLKGRLPEVREIKMPHKEASYFEAVIRTKDGRQLFKLDFGYGKKEDKVNVEHLVECWNCYDEFVKICEIHRDLSELDSCGYNNKMVNRILDKYGVTSNTHLKLMLDEKIKVVLAEIKGGK